jgi:hypothetical protein
MIEINAVTDDSSINTPESTIDRTCSKKNPFDERMTPLASCFTPGPFDVICARGGEARNHSGNNTFKQKIKESTEAYAKADSKLYKSLVVSSVVDFFRNASPDGGFVKKHNVVWYEVGDQLAREKVGQALRDQLHSQYKSSTKAKRRRWRKESQQKVSSDEFFDCVVKANQCITEQMQMVEAKLTRLEGIGASDESLLRLFTQNNALILNTISSDQKLQDSIKKFTF